MNSGFGVISSLSVEEGFRQVDRKFFVPKVSYQENVVKSDDL